MIEVETENGVVEFPDGTPEEVIKRVLRKKPELTSSGQPAKPQPGPLLPKPVGLEEAGLKPGITAQEVGQELKAGVRPAMVAAGATAGGAVGMAAGPAGLVAGSSGGAAAGSLVFDSLNDALEALGLERLPGGQEEPGARMGAALGEAKTELMFTGGFSLVFPVKRFLGPVIGKTLGVRGEGAKNLRRLAASQGIELSAVDVGGPVAKGFAKVLGIFPFTGTPLRRAMRGKQAQVAERAGDILNEIAPTSTLAGEVGVDLMQAAQRADKKFQAISAALYNPLRDDMRKLPVPTIPTSETLASISRFAEESRLGQVPLVGEEVQVLKGGIPEGFEEFIKDAQRLPSHLTYDQHARLQKQLEGFIDQLSPDPFTVKRVAQIKQAMEKDLNDIGQGIDAPELQDILEELRLRKQGADAWFANGIVTFQTPTAQTFGRVDKRIFKAGADKPGSLNPDELMTHVFKVNSPQALRDLRSLVGDEAFLRATRAHMEDVVERSFKDDILDVDLLQANLGLVRGNKDRSLALEEMLKGTGIKVQDLKDLVENVRITKINDPSTFVARRVTLGGAAALVAALGVGAAGAPGAITPVVLTVLARASADVLANPRHLKWMTAALNPELSEVQRRAFALRLIRSLGSALNEQPGSASGPAEGTAPPVQAPSGSSGRAPRRPESLTGPPAP